jgi:hypothetical protein
LSYSFVCELVKEEVVESPSVQERERCLIISVRIRTQKCLERQRRFFLVLEVQKVFLLNAFTDRISSLKYVGHVVWVDDIIHHIKEGVDRVINKEPVIVVV